MTSLINYIKLLKLALYLQFIIINISALNFKQIYSNFQLIYVLLILLLNKNIISNQNYSKIDILPLIFKQPISNKEKNLLHFYILTINKISHTTIKGRIRRYKVILILGSGNLWISFGYGKHESLIDATNKALFNAKKNVLVIPSFIANPIYLTNWFKFKNTYLLIKYSKKNLIFQNNYIINCILSILGITSYTILVRGSTTKINIIKACHNLLKSNL